MLKWFLIAAGVLGLLIVATLAAMPWFLDTPAFQAYVAQSATNALGRPVRFQALSIAAFPLPTVKLRSLQVAEDPAFGPGPFLSVGEGRIGIRLRPLLSGRVELANLTLEEPRIDLVEDGRGHWNWASLGVPAPGAGGAPRPGGRAASPAAGAMLLARVSVVNGSMRYRKVGVKSSEVRLEKINLTVSQTAPGGALRLSGDAVAQPWDLALNVSNASLTPAGVRSFAEAAVKATVDVEARDVAPLGTAFAPSPALAGALKGRLEIAGTPGNIAATGIMRFDRLTLSEERPQCEPRRRQLQLGDLRIPIAYTGTEVESVPLEAKLAQGAVSLRLAVIFGSATVATLRDIRIEGVQLAPILVDYLCQPFAVTGPMDLTGEASLQVADPGHTTSGSGRLRIGPGKIVGREVVTLVNELLALAGVASAVLEPDRRVRPGLPLDFDSVTATYTIRDGVVRTDDLLYRGADVRVAAAGTFALSDGRLNMDVTLTQGQNEVKGVVSGAAGALRVVPTAVRVPDKRGIRQFLEKLFR